MDEKTLGDDSYSAKQDNLPSGSTLIPAPSEIRILTAIHDELKVTNKSLSLINQRVGCLEWWIIGGGIIAALFMLASPR